MALILNIETTTTNCSVALSDNGHTVCIKETAEEGYSHGEKLHSYIDWVFRQSEVVPHSIDAVAVSKGPGSYTGLRIGVSAAKGLCYALNKPLISVSTLKSLALQMDIEAGVIIPVLDARRMEVYSAVFDHNYEMLRAIKAEVLTPEIYGSLHPEKGVLAVIGNAANKAEEVLDNSSGKLVFKHALPSANDMGQLSELKYQISDVEDVAYFEPYYLKDFIAVKPKPLF